MKKVKYPLSCYKKNIIIPQILELRKKGMTLKAIGDILNITRERVRQWEVLGIEMERNEETFDEIENLHLSARTKNALRNNGITRLITLQIQSEYGFSHINGIGPKGDGELKRLNL